MLNLLTDKWLPVIRRRSGYCAISIPQIAESNADDPVIRVAWPRPDFRVATLELLTGLLATMFLPSEEHEWLERWHHPPDPVELEAAFATFVYAFALDGPGPRFLQDVEALQCNGEPIEKLPIERLLIEAPGKKTVRENTDIMVHRGRIASLSRAASAIALYTLQSWAPTGGSGHYTGLRGGGPMVTMVMPGSAPTVWQTVWANVPAGGLRPTPEDLPRVFPWLATAGAGDGKNNVTPQSAHALQCWWGMPRRIWLDFVDAGTPAQCDLTGILDHIRVTSWRQRTLGAKYSGWGGIHPLSPHYRQRPESEKLTLHPRSARIGFRDWLGVVVGTPNGLSVPAAAVSVWRSDRRVKVDVHEPRLLAAGFDMNKMKATDFIECEMPLPGAADMDLQIRIDMMASGLVASTDLVANLLRAAVRDALRIDADTIEVAAVDERLWDSMEPHFFSMLEDVARSAGDDSDGARTGWLRDIRRLTLGIFDDTVPLSVSAGGSAAQRMGRARRYLGISLAGYGKAGAKLFEILQQPPVETKKTKQPQDT